MSEAATAARHTPGPMHTGGRMRLRDSFGEVLDVIPVLRLNTPTKVGGFAYVPVIKGAEEECYANAALIAAATGLVEGLRAERAKVDFLLKYGEGKWGDEWWPGHEDEEGILEVDTEAALKKAEVV